MTNKYDKVLGEYRESDSGTETDPLSIHLDQTTPQTVSGGMPTFSGGLLAGDKIKFTQTDGNEYIDSLADGYMDYRATTAHRFGDGTNYTSIGSSGQITFTGTAGIVLPHLMQSDITDQAITDSTEEQIVSFDTDVHYSGWTRTSATRFTCTKASSYHMDISAMARSGVAGKKLAIWLKVNGDNVANSATYYTFKSANATTVITVAFLQHFDVGDYFEVWMWGDDTGIKLDSIAAVADDPGVTPAIPACPSIILTVNLAGQD